MDKRKSSVFIAFLIFMTFICPHAAEVFAAGDEPSSWAAEQVNTAKMLEILPGDLQSNYQTPITRIEFCRLAIIVAGRIKIGLDSKQIDSVTQLHVFTDTRSEDVNAAYYLGIVDGTSASTFSPERNITRQEAAKMLGNLLTTTGAKVSPTPRAWSDLHDIAPWALVDVNRVASAGIMNGTGGKAFSPLATYTREQAICTFVRLLYNTKGDGTLRLRRFLQVDEIMGKLSLIGNELIYTDGDLDDYDPYEAFIKYQDDASREELLKALKSRQDIELVTSEKVKISFKVTGKNTFTVTFAKSD